MTLGLQDTADEGLITAVLAGDDEAFAQLVSRYKRRIFSLAARFFRDRDELDDICQDVFIKAYENLRHFRRDAPFEHWLSRIATRTCLDALERQRRNRSYNPPEGELAQIRDTADEQRQESRLARELLEWAMSRLRPEEQLVITLMELEEYSVRETAELTGWSESNVKVRAHRARQALKKILENDNAR